MPPPPPDQRPSRCRSDAHVHAAAGIPYPCPGQVRPRRGEGRGETQSTVGRRVGATVGGGGLPRARPPHRRRGPCLAPGEGENAEYGRATGRGNSRGGGGGPCLAPGARLSARANGRLEPLPEWLRVREYRSGRGRAAGGGGDGGRAGARARGRSDAHAPHAVPRRGARPAPPACAPCASVMARAEQGEREGGNAEYGRATGRGNSGGGGGEGQSRRRRAPLGTKARPKMPRRSDPGACLAG
jgi:hypothetical protein